MERQAICGPNQFVNASLSNFEAYSVLNSVGVTALILLVSLLPSIVLNKNPSLPFIVFIVSFFCYWISNPNLGQTTFWVVGAANYMWTMLYICIYIATLHTIHNKSQDKVSFVSYILVFTLSVIAGWSSEGAGWFPLAYSMIGIYLFKRDTALPILGSIGSLMGYCLLIFSPGNYNRLEHPLFQDWVALSIYEKVMGHIIYRVPEVLSGFWFLYVLLVFALLLNAIFIKEKCNKAQVLSLFFFVASFN
ncbi:phage protein [Vibrio ishigakensis]|uniref:Phage protein n=1 Tax=Vibrio ishigakensis TaxID=1481914 RepID=A0A0B8Q9A3_9VIBR|nr:phage protein [Vibrio ishigakensis]